MTKIEWAMETLNPIRARRKSDGKVGWHCVRISPGCGDGTGGGCYAEKQNIQCGNNPGRNGTGFAYNVPSLSQVELFLDEETLLQPLRWKAPRRIFWCSMTDWMADFVPNEFRDKMLAVMALTPQHTHQTLTKRADRQKNYFTSAGHSHRVWVQMVNIDCAHHLPESHPGYSVLLRPDATDKPLPSLWLGISCESSEYKDRIDILRKTPAAVRMLSLEPLLEDLGALDLRGIHWVIVGGESGPNARPMHPEWARSIRDKCQAQGVPFFMKQWGEWCPYNPNLHGSYENKRFMHHDGRVIGAFDPNPDGMDVRDWAQITRVGKKAAGRLLDGRTWDEYPKGSVNG